MEIVKKIYTILREDVYIKVYIGIKYNEYYRNKAVVDKISSIPE